GGILAPANPIIGIDTPTSASVYPNNEPPFQAIDGSNATKYLNFGRENSGLIVTPHIGASIADSLQITTGNDSPERDVSVFSVFGTNASINSMDNSLGDEEVWTLIADHL